MGRRHHGSGQLQRPGREKEEGRWAVGRMGDKRKTREAGGRQIGSK